MKKLNFTSSEIQRLHKTISWRIKILNGYESPEEYKRSMWPISVDGDMMKEYERRHKNRQKTLETYKSILKKIES